MVQDTGAGASVVMTTNGDMVYYNSGRQRLTKGSDDQILTQASGIPSWADASSGGATLTRTLKQSSSYETTTSTSLVDISWSSHTCQSGAGICIAMATCQTESTAAGYLAFDFATDGTQPETWMGKPSNDLLNSCNTSCSTTLGGQVAIMQFRAQSGTCKMQSDSGYISMVFDCIFAQPT